MPGPDLAAPEVWDMTLSMVGLAARHCLEGRSDADDARHGFLEGGVWQVAVLLLG